MSNIWIQEMYCNAYMHRIAYNIDNATLRGRLVTCMGTVERYGCMWHVVRLVNRDGSLGGQWFIKPGMLIPFS